MCFQELAPLEIEEFIPLYKVLHKSRSTHFNHMINGISNKALKHLICGIWNILKGTIVLEDPKDLKRAKGMKHLYRKVLKKRTSLKNKKLILSENRHFLNFNLRIIIDIFSV